MNSTCKANAAIGPALLLLAGLVAAPTRAGDDSPRDLFLAGRYEEAADAFRAQSPQNATTAVGISRAQLAQGQIQAALDTLRGAAEREPKSPLIHAQQAFLHWEQGAGEQAQQEAHAAIQLDENSVLAHWVQAELLRTTGRLVEARQAYEWFLALHQRVAERVAPDDARLVGLAAAQLARWNRDSRQFQQLVDVHYPAILQQSPNYWPAHLELAKLFLEKYNTADAQAAVSAGLAINPHAAELHALRAAIALRGFDLALAKTALDRALAINPNLLVSQQLRADWLFADVRPREAITVLELARQLNLHHELTLGRLAAAYTAVDGKHDGKLSPRGQALRDEVLKRNPQAGEFFLAAGDSFDLLRRYPLAAEHYREAHRLLPQLIGVQGQLGMTLMRLGKEAEAAKLLEEAFAGDPFNVRVKNTLEVLDVLQGYAVLETAHFVLKFDRGQSELLARSAAKILETEIYPQLTAEFQFQPQEKTLIEIFSRSRNTSGHGWFSARMVGLPAIGTVGACAGKIVALTSPDELPKKYDWARVLRHEFTHVLNLQQTDFNVPHWFTEGLAVCAESRPRPREWNQVLARRAGEHKLYNVDTLTLGFVRPQNQDDWTLAYCQAALYVDLLKEKFGPRATGSLLAAYAQGLSTPEALRQCFQIDQAELEREYQTLLEKIVAAQPAAPTRERTFSQRLSDAQTQPENVDAAAELAKAYLERDEKPAARRWAESAQKKAPKQQLAAWVFARLQMTIGDADGAVALLEKALDEANPHQDHLALLAGLKLKQGDSAAAERLYALGQRRFPASDRWLKGLARLYLQTAKPEKLRPILVQLAEIEQDSMVIRKKLAELALEAKDWEAAQKWGDEALRLDLQDAEVHALVGAARLNQGQFAAAAEELEIAVKLEGNHPQWRLSWATALAKLGKPVGARAVVDDLPLDYPGRKELLESLQP